MNQKFTTQNLHVHGAHTFVIRYPHISPMKEAKQKYFRVLLQLILLNSILFITKLYRFKYLSPGGFSLFSSEYPNYTDKNTVEKRPVDLYTLQGRNLCVFLKISLYFSDCSSTIPRTNTIFFCFLYNFPYLRKFLEKT